MRQLNKNKQILYYANYVGEAPIFAQVDKSLSNEEDDAMLTESESEILVDDFLKTDVNGQTVYVIDAYKDKYSEIIKFRANISFNSGETDLSEYGLNPSDYNAIISADKGKLPFDERTLIWYESSPEFDYDGLVKPETADYKVVAIKTSLNEERFILKKRVDD